MKKFILFTIIFGLMCPTVFADNSAVFDKDGNLTLNWETEDVSSSLVVWVSKDGETVFANMMTAEEAVGGTLNIEMENINDGDTVTVEYAGDISYSEEITFDERGIIFEDLNATLDETNETETLETVMKYKEYLKDKTEEKLGKLKTNAEKAKMESAIVNGEFSDFDELEKIIDDTYEEILKDRKEKENKKNNSSSSSSSSSGGGGGSSIRVPAVSAPIVVPQPENKYDFEEPVCKFEDIESVEWAQESITKLFKKGVISGTDEKTFSPDEHVTRGQFVKMLVCAFNALDEKAVSNFDDVPKTNWCYPYVSSAYASGLVNGISETYFGINEKISRQDAAVMVYRFMQKYTDRTVNGEAGVFADKSEIAEYAAEAVDYMSASGIINGVGENRFEPDGVCTRAMAAKIICAAAYEEE